MPLCAATAILRSCQSQTAWLTLSVVLRLTVEVCSELLLGRSQMEKTVRLGGDGEDVGTKQMGRSGGGKKKGEGRYEMENEGELWHVRYECRVIKMTSDGGATNTVSFCRRTLNEDGFQGLWLRTKSRGAKDEVQQENQFTPPSFLLPLRERFTSQVMTVYNNGSHILLLLSDNSIRGQSKLPQNQSCYH